MTQTDTVTSIAAKLRAGRKMEQIARVTRIILWPIKWPLLLCIYCFGAEYHD